MLNLTSLGGVCGGGLPCVPGYDRFSIGFDAVTGDMPEEKLQLLDFTFDDTNWYTNPFDKSLNYSIPDQVRVIDDTSADQLVATSTFRDVSSYTDHLSAKAKISVGWGWFGASAEAEFARDIIENTKSYGAMSTSELHVNCYDLVLAKMPALTNDAANFIQTKLPTTFKAVDYLPFIEKYGTHYIQSAKLGGAGYMSSSIYSETVSSESDSYISSEVSTHFLFLKAGGSVQHEVHDASSSFVQNSAFSESTEGGDAGLSLTDWDKWVQTFYDAPAMIEYTLKPITDLLTDISSDIKANIATMIDQYRLAASTRMVAIKGIANGGYTVFNTEYVHSGTWNDYPAYCADISGYGNGNAWLIYEAKAAEWQLRSGYHTKGVRGTCSQSLGHVTGYWGNTYDGHMRWNYVPCSSKLSWQIAGSGGDYHTEDAVTITCYS